MSGLVSGGGNLKAALIGGFTAMAFNSLHGWKLNGWTDPIQALGKSIAHGVVGGISSRLNGGSFREGFMAAAITQASSLAVGDKFLGTDIGRFEVKMSNAFAAAIVGGTASRLSGGSFENGAITGAFSRLFNDLQNDIKKNSEIDKFKLALDVIDFGRSTIEAGFGVIFMSNPLTFPVGAVMAVHGSAGMLSNGWSIGSNLNLIDAPGVYEYVGGSLGREVGANAGMVLDGVTSISGGIKGIGKLNNLYDGIDAAQGGYTIKENVEER